MTFDIESVWSSTTTSSDEDGDWSEPYLVDRLKEHLAKVKGHTSAGKKLYDDRKYYNQCYDFLLLGTFKPIKLFPVSLSDLSDKILEELGQLDNNLCKHVLKQSVGRIFEDINSRLYHDSISRVLEVILVD